MPRYKPQKTEKKWQQKWDKDKLYFTNFTDSKRKKYYNLVMFPYPSGDKLHIGHWYSYAPADSWGRYMRLKGYNVYEPMGFDSFGLPAENYAIKTGVHPAESTKKNVNYMRKQLKVMGTMYDWDTEVMTSSPDYYKWTQWVFLQLYKKGLAYKNKAPVNWCPGCQTVLANEQVIEDKCERCDSEVEQKDLEQWFFKIRDYADRLDADLDLIDWPESTKISQRNWIGKKHGIDINYEVEGFDEKITVFTTRPDTNFGATFVVLAPDCEFVKKNIDKFPEKEKCEKYIEKTKHKTELERISEGRTKTGAFTGLYALNNLNGQKMPVYLSDFVLTTVGTGAVVGVPGHDLRDFEFAQKFKLDIIRVVVGPDGDKSEITKPAQVQEKAGTMVNSEFLDGLDIHNAKEKIKDHFEKKGWGKRIITYRLRDWLISRQRFWGAPIPIIYCDKCGQVPVSEKDLPVKLPIEGVDFKPKGKSPLMTASDFVNTECPKCGGAGKREVDTMDTFVCSSWYFLRYPSANNDKEAFNKDLTNKWLPVDMYIGGPEHACMHLLYARFINKALKDCGFINFEEPFKKLVHQGLITKDSVKMSKSKGNVVSPDEFVEQYGSDIFRMYLMFMGPFTEGGDWNDSGIKGIARFVDKFYNLISGGSEVQDGKKLQAALHKTIKKVGEDMEKFQFNTTVSALMEFTNAAQKTGIDKESKKIAVHLIAPLAPHLAEELWEILGESGSIFNGQWPEYDSALIIEDTIELVVQINGKVRAKTEVSSDISEKDAIETAKSLSNIKAHIEGKQVIKEIYVPGRLVNIVVK
jgi:leucyl-tRNA synthetase